MSNIHEPIESKFWKRTRTHGSTSCWEWLGPTSEPRHDGYGRLYHLKPCPHCGKEPHLHECNGEAWVHCDECGEMSDTVEQAIAIWNHRVYQLEPPPAVLPVVDPEKAPLTCDDVGCRCGEERAPRAPQPERGAQCVEPLSAGAPGDEAHCNSGDLRDPEVYRRALDVALMTGRLTPIAGDICDLSDAIAAERERRKP